MLLKLYRIWWVRLIVTLISLGVVVSAPGVIIRLWQRREYVQERQSELSRLEQENAKLRRELAETQSPSFIEKLARDKLGLVKEGETVVIIPKPQTSNLNDQTKIEEIPNWKKWWKLFF